MTGPSRDWDREMAEIDKLIAGGASAAPAPAKAAPAAAPARAAAPVPATPRAAVIGLWFRLVLVAGLVAAFAVWPFAKWCGGGLALYLGSLVLGLLLLLSALGSSWTHRRGVGHLVGLGLLAALLGLATAEVLPRIGYAKDVRPWSCAVLESVPPAPTAPAPPAAAPSAPALPAPAR